MHLKVQLPSLVEAESYAVTLDGKKVAIKELVIEPVFFVPGGQVTVLYLDSQDSSGDTIMKFVVKQSGRTGLLNSYKLQPRVPTYEVNLIPEDEAEEVEEIEEEEEDADE